MGNIHQKLKELVLECSVTQNHQTAYVTLRSVWLIEIENHKMTALVGCTKFSIIDRKRIYNESCCKQIFWVMYAVYFAYNSRKAEQGQGVHVLLWKKRVRLDVFLAFKSGFFCEILNRLWSFWLFSGILGILQVLAGFWDFLRR